VAIDPKLVLDEPKEEKTAMFHAVGFSGPPSVIIQNPD